MLLSDDWLNRFLRAYEDTYGVTLSVEEAAAIGYRLVALYELVARSEKRLPSPQDQGPSRSVMPGEPI
jgi:hypothetical protein